MIAFHPTSLAKIRKEFRGMMDAKLIEKGKLLRGLRSPQANFGKPPRDVWVQQLDEAIVEWRRRHPKTQEEKVK